MVTVLVATALSEVPSLALQSMVRLGSAPFVPRASATLEL